MEAYMSDLVSLRVKHDIKEGRYWVSLTGKVYWKDKKGAMRLMKPFETKDGYVEYVLTKTDGRKQHIQAQIIVMSTFKNYPKDKRKIQVNHKDGNRKNNTPDNLEWMTPKQNIKHSFDTLGKVVWNSNKK
jgi:hypothetical protein